MKIFVTVGTQDKAFNRLVEKCAKLKNDYDFFVQNGYTACPCLKHQDYLTPKEMHTMMVDADIVIMHGGVGSIIEALKLNKIIIVLPRLAKYGEHQNDHQIEIAQAFKAKKYLLVCEENDDLNSIIQEAMDFKPAPFISHAEAFQNKLAEYLDSNL